MARLRRGDCDALAALERAVALRANWGEAHIVRARAEALCGSAQAARERAVALLRLADNADTRLTLALAELAIGRAEEARQLAEPVSSHDAASIMDAARAGPGHLPSLAFATSSAWWVPPELTAP